ncbi:hypothetical protein PAXINDRAFT_97186 [Paxillus involutus ATCC 200175]|nr:hypothetical protein PAXINDRAFT_97186 [Paxillus involutus ATCC 200175]
MPSSSSVPFAAALDPVQVPPGCFPIEVVQFWRGERSPRRPYPLHWAIFVRTSPGRGNYYQVAGNIDTFTVDARYNVPLQNREAWRGSHVVGYVAPSHLHNLEVHLAQIPVVRHCRDWNCQNWVYDALKRLNFQELYTDVHLSMSRLQTQMCCLLEAWEIGEI